MYVPNFDLEDMKELRVTVVPRDVELFPHDRAHNKYHCRVDVAVQKKFSKGTNADWLHCVPAELTPAFVADWSQAKIGYTNRPSLLADDYCCGLVSGQDWLHCPSTGASPAIGCGLVSGQDWLHSSSRSWSASLRCGLVSGQDWLHSWHGTANRRKVADWSQAKIGYTR